MNRKAHIYTDEQKAFIKDNIKSCSYKDMATAFNFKFGTQLSCTAIGATIKRLGLANGNITVFPKGHLPFNKGKKGVRVSIDTEFKKGHTPRNWLPVGSERITRDGYTEVKIAEPNRWKQKHKIVYECYRGQIPKGSVVIFADQNKSNLSIDNLILISRRQLLTMNRRNLIKPGFAEGTQAGAIIASISDKIHDLKKKKGDR